MRPKECFSVLFAFLISVTGPMGQETDCGAIMLERMFGGTNCELGPEAFIATCEWEFFFRSPSSRTTFQALSRKLESCAAAVEDAPVNHPDTYALRLYEVGARTVSLSLKDKGKLGKTFVFLRVRATTDD